MRVLICEDNILLALELEFILADLGHEAVGKAVRSTDCFAKAEALRPDVVLVDLNLADGRTGPGLVRRLLVEGIPAVIVSGEVGFLPSDHGAVAVLDKPVDTRALAAILAQMDPARTRDDA